MPVGLALSGGGARGDFQVGALRFLYDQGVRPDVIAGTSVGAVNGAKLAEGESAADQTQGLQGLEAIWTQLQVNSDMYLFEPWLGTIDERIRGFLTGTREDPGIRPPRTDFSEWGDLGWFMGKVSEISWVGSDGAAILQALQAMMSAKALYNLGPIGEKLRVQLKVDRVQDWAAAGGRLRLAAVHLEGGQLRYVTEKGEVLERDNATPVLVRANGVPPECQAVAAEIEALEAERAGLQDDLRFAAPGEKPAIVAQIRALNGQISAQEQALDVCVLNHPQELRPLQVGLVEGVLASASIPGIFRPVVMGNGTYVDGGVREVLPLQAAVDLGADDVWAIHCSKEAPDERGPFTSSTLLEIVGRSLTDLAIGEIARDDTRTNGNGNGHAPLTVRVIQPTVDLHDATTIDPGLIAIGMAYGWMRAADVFDRVPPGDRAWQLADRIALVRREAWRLECLANGQPLPTEPAAGVRPADPSLEPTIQSLKDELRGLLAERSALGRRVPADADRWSQTLERHPWVIPTRAAEFVAQSIPDAMAPGSQHEVTVVMRNTGTLPWVAGEGYRLGSDNPPDNGTWGLGRVDVPAMIGRFAEATFRFTVTAPSAPGTYTFQWRMLQEGVEWFGDASPTASITVAAPEPAECPNIRMGIAAAQDEITALRGALEGLDPKNAGDRIEIREIRRQIADAEGRVSALRQRSAELGCH
jgi:NTE family protein